MSQEELMKQLNTISRSFSERIRRDRAIEEIIYEKMKTYEIPYLVFKDSKRSRIQVTPMVSTIVRYWPAGTGRRDQKASIVYGSTIYHLDTGNMRIAPKALQDQLIQINDQMNELHKKKQELIDSYWSKCPKLTWQKAEDYEAIRKQYWPEGKHD